MSDAPYSNIRSFLEHMIGKRIINITQHDEDEFAENGQSYVMLLLEGGDYLKFPIGDDGFEHTEDET